MQRRKRTDETHTVTGVPNVVVPGVVIALVLHEEGGHVLTLQGRSEGTVE